MKTRIAISDDHPMIIGGLHNLLRDYPDIELINTYATAEATLEGLEKDLPDILVLDIQLPDKNGDELALILLKKYPLLRILTLTNLSSALYAYNMLRYGVQGYVLKSSDPQSLILAIEKVNAGGQFIDPLIEDKLKDFSAKKEASLKPSLTPREKEILLLTVNGDTIKEISEKLFIGLRTVEYYRSNLFLKLEVKNLAALVKKSLELGLLD